ncbi:MAG: DUF4381 domain-containing protein [Gammaproteobacteria bacterium]|nr:MAG: DUF4381 domain-containing protein [Gammaproteobacteria bacterium]
MSNRSVTTGHIASCLWFSCMAEAEGRMNPQSPQNPAAGELPLRDIHLPDPIDWWPPAPGWWIVLLLVLLTTTLLLRWYFRSRKQRRVYQSAFNELRQIEMEYRQHKDDLKLVQALSILLRRIAMTVTSRDQVASLTGDDWLRFLDEGLGENSSAQTFSQGTGRSLIEAPYNPHASVDHQALLELCQHWVVTVSRKTGPYHAAV